MWFGAAGGGARVQRGFSSERGRQMIEPAGGLGWSLGMNPRLKLGMAIGIEALLIALIGVVASVECHFGQRNNGTNATVSVTTGIRYSSAQRPKRLASSPGSATRRPQNQNRGMTKTAIQQLPAST